MRIKRMGTWILTALCALVMLAFFSALIVRPEAAEAAAPVPELPLTATHLLPYALPAPDAQPDAPKLDCQQRAVPLAPPDTSGNPASIDAYRDANGHVIALCRYLDCVYQAFRQETACG